MYLNISLGRHAQYKYSLLQILRISEKYTPEISKNIVAKIINYDKESKSINSQILGKQTNSSEKHFKLILIFSWKK